MSPAGYAIEFIAYFNRVGQLVDQMRAIDWTVRLNMRRCFVRISGYRESVSDAYVLDVLGSADVLIDIR